MASNDSLFQNLLVPGVSAVRILDICICLFSLLSFGSVYFHLFIIPVSLCRTKFSSGISSYLLIYGAVAVVGSQHFGGSPSKSHRVRNCFVFPESVWAQGSSNSGGLSNIFSSSHLLIFTSSHLHIFSSSHLLIFTSSHLHIFSSSHPHIFTSLHLHIFSSSHSSHLHVFTSSHLHICSSSRLLIFTSSHLHICSSSHLLIFTSSHLHILTSSHLLIFTSSHLHILTSSHLLIFTSSHSLLPSCSLALLLSCPLALLPSCSLLLFYFSLEGAGQCQRDGTKRNPFARNEVGSPKTEVKLRFAGSCRNPFARNEVRSPKTE